MQIKNKIKLFFLIATLGASGSSYGMEERLSSDSGNEELDKLVTAIKESKSLENMAGCFVVDLRDDKEVNKFVNNDLSISDIEARSKLVVLEAIGNPKFFKKIEKKLSQKDTQIFSLSEQLLDHVTQSYLEKYGSKSSKVVKYGLPIVALLGGTVVQSYLGTPVELVLPAIITAAAALCLQKPFKSMEKKFAGERSVAEKQVLDEVNEIFYSDLWNNRLTSKKKIKLLRQANCNAGMAKIIWNNTWELLLELLEGEEPDKANTKLKDDLKGLLQNALIENFETELSDFTWFNKLTEEERLATVNKYVANPTGIDGNISNHDMRLLKIAEMADAQKFTVVTKKAWNSFDETVRIQKLKTSLPGFFPTDDSDKDVAYFCEVLDKENWEDEAEKKAELLTAASLASAMGGINFADTWTKTGIEEREHLSKQHNNINLNNDDGVVLDFAKLPMNFRIAFANDKLTEELSKRAFKKFNANKFKSAIDYEYNSSWGMVKAQTAKFALLASIFGVAFFGSKKLMNWLDSENYKKLKNASALFFNDKIQWPLAESFRLAANGTRPYTTRKLPPLPPFVDVRYLNEK